jgi:hypothetical protein
MRNSFFSFLFLNLISGGGFGDEGVEGGGIGEGRGGALS